ncbi:unnamed protein product [Effrenium voratum]|nr:unnamed protein product [Effrenium voratum]
MADLSRASEATLAKKLSEMLAGSVMVYPNPVETEIEKRKVAFLEDRENFFILKSAVGKTPADFEKVLKKLKNAKTIRKLHLYPIPGWSEKDPVFDFTNFSELLRKYLPRVCYFGARHMLLKKFELKNLPKLRTVCLTSPEMQDEKWNLELPNLEELILECHAPPGKPFAQSLIQCPRIKCFFSHKYCADALLGLYLPNCEDFTLRRADCLSKISVYLPRLKSLNLDADYDLKDITFLKKGHASHAEFNLPPDRQSRFRLSCQNALLGPRAKQALRNSGRLLNAKALKEDLDDCRFSGLPFGSLGSEGEDEEDEDSMHHLLGKMVKVTCLKTRKNLIGKEGKIIEIFAEKERVGVRFAHDESLELSIHIDNLEVVEGPPRKKLKKLREVN